MGNCLSGSANRPSGDSGGRVNGQLETSVNVVGVPNAVGIHGGLSETTVGGDQLSHPGNTHLQHVHHRNTANALPPPPDVDSNSQVSKVSID